MCVMSIFIYTQSVDICGGKFIKCAGTGILGEFPHLMSHRVLSYFIQGLSRENLDCRSERAWLCIVIPNWALLRYFKLLQIFTCFMFSILVWNIIFPTRPVLSWNLGLYMKNKPVLKERSISIIKVNDKEAFINFIFLIRQVQIKVFEEEQGKSTEAIPLLLLVRSPNPDR